MTRAFLIVVALATLAACGPQTRTYAWYKAHPDVATRAAEACGPSRSEDCANAERAVAGVKYEQRRDLYRKAF